ncbi:hypothetical protein N7468_007786 [Penicillium chermesinum]|uniref:Fe2OG dioxygenase domain-containing protein n=1 Tax=Penicillium chermesinum TaxID=63820 RepID=A0A9W9NNJ2_9EURO|nr:uncharacterized protein N7468_007786 [Penicillium chermesinum]KAJ5223244.1 hypothetical protein N7468_007786 [Penicillium chermesinum]
MAHNVPNTTGQVDLPMIDLSHPDGVGSGKALLDAAVKYGFLYVDSRTCAFSGSDIDQMFAISEEFFGLSTAEKLPFRRGANNRGWVGMHVETLDPEHHEKGDFKEALNIGELENGTLQQPLPSCTAAHERTIARFTELCNQTCSQILQFLAHGLEIPGDYFTSRHDPSHGATGNSLRLLYYPASITSYRSGKDIRAGAHSDYGSITLLFQRPGQPGLEIKTAPESEWAPVPVYPDTPTDYPFPPILVNIGDMLSYWTDGLLKSTIHRVVFPHEAQREGANDRQDRYSIAFFCQPVGSTELTTVPSAVVAAHRKEQSQVRGSSVGYGGGAVSLDDHRATAAEHLQSRFAATYITK